MELGTERPIIKFRYRITDENPITKKENKLLKIKLATERLITKFCDRISNENSITKKENKLN